MTSINYSDVWAAGVPTHYTDITVDATAGGVQLLPANTSRKSVVLQNTGSGNVRVAIDGSAPTPTHGLQLSAGSSIELNAEHVPVGVVKAIREGATSSTVSVMEVV